MSGTRFRTPQARDVREAGFFFTNNFFFAKTIDLFYRSKCQNRHFEVPYVVSGTHFRALRARGAREAKISHDVIIFMARRFQRAIARPNPYTWCQNLPGNTPIII